MGTSKTGDGWTVEVDSDVMVWEFLPGMELAAFREDAYPIFEELLETHDIDGMVTVGKLDDPFTGDVFEVWEETGQRLNQSNVDRWAVVADGIKAISLRGKVDVGDLDTLATEDRTEAIDWAKSL
ncbi:hypothetical protein [Salinibaculum salinum]|uniref:hypothetical protein n=1 Tax=Salinibaculum salinum TaxID=3131996 RepID=UPI0030EF103E